jgi:dolichyl-phosphate-mannose-protein mannosyltransferase
VTVGTAATASPPPSRPPGSPPAGLVASWLDSPTGLAGLFALGLLIRILAARTSAGLQFDVSLFRQWSDRLVQHGPSEFYGGGFADYPPGYLYVLLLLGRAWRALSGGGGGPLPVPVLKLPAIIADLGLAVLAVWFAERFTPGAVVRRVSVRPVAAAAILFNPALILVSSVWGQVDSVLALLVGAGIYLLTTGRPGLWREASGVGVLAVAFATKPQALLALPIVAVVLAYRHTRVGSSSPRTWILVAARAGVLVGLAVVVVWAMFRPFRLGHSDIPRFYRYAGSLYQFTSLWAFNAWGVVGFYRSDVGLAYPLGLAAAGVATVALALRSWRSLDRGVDAGVVALFGVVAVTSVAFALLTRMHERYLYLAVAGLAPFVAYRPLRWALAGLSIAFFLNVHFVYVYFSRNSLPPGDAWTIQPLYHLLFGTAQDAWERKVLSILTSLGCLAVAWLGWRALERRAPDIP